MEAGKIEEAGKWVVLKAVKEVTACLYACRVPSVRAALSRCNITGAKVEDRWDWIWTRVKPPGTLRTPESETGGQQ